MLTHTKCSKNDTLGWATGSRARLARKASLPGAVILAATTQRKAAAKNYYGGQHDQRQRNIKLLHVIEYKLKMK